ncbi:sulfatase [soil metagenome]
MINKYFPFLIFVTILLFITCSSKTENLEKQKTSANFRRPNILFAISDDQSYPHASIYGATWIKTPAFDRIAREGVLFNNAFTASPGCSPSRAAILTGLNCWQLEEAGTHASSFPIKFKGYPDILEEAGYFVGYTGKGWGPGNWEVSGRKRNPAGVLFNNKKLEPPLSGISAVDYAGNFADFMAQRPEGQPFCFWYGAHEPHREFEKGSDLKARKKLGEVEVPPFLPDTEEVRSDLLDYALEIEWFDQHLERMLKLLEEAGELDNTIIVVTSDNGMAFPRAKANLYEYGFHVPLAIRWADQIKGGRNVDEVVSLVDLAPTYMEAAGISFQNKSNSPPMAGHSLLNLMKNNENKISSRNAAFAARERHSSSRWNNLTYPQRSIRTENYLYIRNFKPERWPAGAPQKYEEDGTLGSMHHAYHDIDACPTQDFLVEHIDDPEINKYLLLAVGKRPEEEFFNIKNDPDCLQNLAEDPAYLEALLQHRQQLGGYLMETEDPRVTGKGDIYESYIRYSPIRSFPEPDWASKEEKLRFQDL